MTKLGNIFDALTNLLNEHEGWNVFNTVGSEHGDYQIQRVDDNIFEDNHEAIKFIIAKVVIDKSMRHKTALQYIAHYNRMQWETIKNLAVKMGVENFLETYLY